MAIIRRGILGGFSGKVANIVGSSWKGIAVMRSLPLSVANPKTPKQVKQRDKFAEISKFASQLLTVWIKPLWDRKAQKMSGYNAFVQKNIDTAFLDGVFEPFGVTMSEGVLGETQVYIDSRDGQSITVKWDAVLSNSLQSNTDLAYIVVVDKFTGKLYASSSALVARSVGKATIALTEEGNANDNLVYLAFADTDGIRTSPATMDAF